MYKCLTCNKEFSRKFNLENHKFKLYPCKPSDITENNQVNIVDIKLENNKCIYCNKEFSQKYNLTKHYNGHCKIKKEHDKKKIDDSTMLAKLKEMFEQHLKNNINITNNNNITNNITNNIQINIVSAGKEDLSRLTQEEILKICTSGTFYPIVAAEIIHCNKNYPEFQNFLISNLRSSTGLVFLNDTWISKNQDELLTNIMQIDKKHVKNLIKELKIIKDLKVDDKFQIKLESTIDEVNGNESKEHQKPKIKSKLYNASKMILKNKKNLDKNLLDN